MNRLDIVGTLAGIVFFIAAMSLNQSCNWPHLAFKPWRTYVL